MALVLVGDASEGRQILAFEDSACNCFGIIELIVRTEECSSLHHPHDFVSLLRNLLQPLVFLVDLFFVLLL